MPSSKEGQVRGGGDELDQTHQRDRQSKNNREAKKKRDYSDLSSGKLESSK